MPPRVRRSSRIVRGGARRKLVWATTNGATVVTGDAANFNFDLLTNLRTAGASVLGATVIRTHARWSLMWPDTGFAPQGLAVGFCTQSLTFVTGQLVDLAQDEDWAYRDRFLMGTGVNTLAGADVPIEGFRLDLRSKRKVQELNQTWCMAMSFQNAQTAGDVMNVAWFVRTLIALP